MGSGSDKASLIQGIIDAGKIVPVEITCSLLKQAMEKAGWASKKYLIDGFPRNKDNFDGWTKEMGDITETPFIFYFKASEEEMTERIIERGKTSGRSDDTKEILHKRFMTFQNDSMPVIDSYKEKGHCKEIDAMGTVDEVYARFTKSFESHL